MLLPGIPLLLGVTWLSGAGGGGPVLPWLAALPHTSNAVLLLCPSACGVPAAGGAWSTPSEESFPRLTSVSSALRAGESAGVSGLGSSDDCLPCVLLNGTDCHSR